MEEEMDCEPQAKSPVATTAKSPANSPIATTPNNNPTSDCSTASLISPDVSETDSSMGHKSREKKRTQDGSVETAATVTPEKKNNNDTSTAKSSAEETTREALQLLKKALDILEKSDRPNPGTEGSDSDASNHSDDGLRAEAIQTTAKILGQLLRGKTAMTSSKDNSSQFYIFNDNSQTIHVGVNSGVVASSGASTSISSATSVEDCNGHPNDKTEGLREFCRSFPFTKFIVYTNSQEKVESAAKMLIEWNETVSTAPEKSTRGERQTILQDFLAGPSRMLISTDQLEKGDQLERKICLIFNLDVPLNKAIYRNRYSIFGSKKKAAVVTIAHREEFIHLMAYANELDIKIVELPSDSENIL